MMLADLEGITEEELEERVHAFVENAEAQIPDLDELTQRIQDYEKQHGLTTIELRAGLKNGTVLETAKICDWLILAELRDQF
jgi:hypothetical protein